jgi:DNA polymerase III delta subunit
MIKEPLSRVYLLAGPDEIRKKELLQQITALATDESFADFDKDVLDASRISPTDALASAGQAPFGSPRRLVVYQGAECLRRKEQSSNAETLAEGLSKLAERSCFVIVAAAPEDRGKGKTALTIKIDNAVKKTGEIILCEDPKPEELAKWLIDICATLGKRLEPAAAQKLAELGDRLTARNELEKAFAYVGDAPIVSKAAVEETRSFDPEESLFKLVDAIFLKDAGASVRLFRNLLRYEQRPQALAGRLLAVLSRQVKMVWQAVSLRSMGISAQDVRSLPAEVAQRLPGDASIIPMAWKARDLYQMAAKWSIEGLIEAQRLLLECDLSNKGSGEGSEDVATNLEVLIVQLTRPV